MTVGERRHPQYDPVNERSTVAELPGGMRSSISIRVPLGSKTRHRSQRLTAFTDNHLNPSALKTASHGPHAGSRRRAPAAGGRTELAPPFRRRRRSFSSGCVVHETKIGRPHRIV